MIRIVLDTNILVAGLSSRSGASNQLLSRVLDEKARLVASPVLWLEYESVLKRPEMLARHRLSPTDVDLVLDTLAALVDPVVRHYLWRPQLSDPKDEMVLETALNGAADALVTFNRRDFLPAADRFGLPLWSPADCLLFLEKRP